MPLYIVECKQCGRRQEIFRRLSEYNDLPECCNVITSRVITPVNVVADIQPYKSMITGEMITSRTKHRAHLKEHGCIEVGNEKIEPKKPNFEMSKKEVDALKSDISQRLESVRNV